MKVDVQIEVVKIDGETLSVGDARSLMLVSSDSDADVRVNLLLGTHSYTVRIQELRAALDACQYAHEFYIPR